jgi:hypothetical protein
MSRSGAIQRSVPPPLHEAAESTVAANVEIELGVTNNLPMLIASAHCRRRIAKAT